MLIHVLTAAVSLVKAPLQWRCPRAAKQNIPACSSCLVDAAVNRVRVRATQHLRYALLLFLAEGSAILLIGGDAATLQIVAALSSPCAAFLGFYARDLRKEDELMWLRIRAKSPK